MLAIGVREAPKRNLKGFLPSRSTGDAPRIAGRRRRPSGFALPGSRELVLILGAPRMPARPPFGTLDMFSPRPGYFFDIAETTGEITAGAFFSRLRVSPHGHALQFGAPRHPVLDE